MAEVERWGDHGSWVTWRRGIKVWFDSSEIMIQCSLGFLTFDICWGKIKGTFENGCKRYSTHESHNLANLSNPFQSGPWWKKLLWSPPHTPHVKDGYERNRSCFRKTSLPFLCAVFVQWNLTQVTSHLTKKTGWGTSGGGGVGHAQPLVHFHPAVENAESFMETCSKAMNFKTRLV